MEKSLKGPQKNILKSARFQAVLLRDSYEDAAGHIKKKHWLNL